MDMIRMLNPYSMASILLHAFETITFKLLNIDKGLRIYRVPIFFLLIVIKGDATGFVTFTFAFTSAKIFAISCWTQV
ncbi:hypothetical protein ACLOJK_013810 [Asimina triloba]